MSRTSFRPKRRLRHELVPVVLLVVSVLALVAVFPHEAVGFAPVRRAPSEASCAWVKLTPEEERAALEASRAAWRVDGGARRGRLEVFAQPLPTAAYGPVLDLADRGHEVLPPVAPYRVGALPGSVAAPSPAELPVSEDIPPPPAFTRRELLEALP